MYHTKLEKSTLTYSDGKYQVLGKNVYSSGYLFTIVLRLRANKSLRHTSDMPGKWFNFYKSLC